MTDIMQNNTKGVAGEPMSRGIRVRADFFRARMNPHTAILIIGCRNGALIQHISRGNRVVCIDTDANRLVAVVEALSLEPVFMDLAGDWADLHGRKFDRIVVDEAYGRIDYATLFYKAAHHLVPGGVLIGVVPGGALAPEYMQAAVQAFGSVEVLTVRREGFFAKILSWFFSRERAFVCAYPKTPTS